MANKRGRETRFRGVRDLGQGLYLIRSIVQDPKTGRRIERQRQIQARSATEALEAKLALEREIKSGDLGASELASRRTLGEVAGEWLERACAARRRDGTARLAPTTRDRYRVTIESSIVPFLGEVRVAALRRQDIERWRDHLAGHYAAATVNGALRVLRTLLRSVDVTVADKVQALAEDDVRITEDEPNALDEEELSAFLAAMRRLHPQHVPMTLVMLTTGARISTVIALEWADIDEAKQTITFRRRRSGDEILPGVKRSRTARDVAPLHPAVWAELEAHREDLNDLQRATGLVFPSTEGGYHARSVLDRAFRDSRRVAGIAKRFTPHGCRRTASALYRKAAGSVVSMAIVGHTTEEMHRHYAGPNTAEKVAAARGAFRLLEGGGAGESGESGTAGGTPQENCGEAVAK